MLTTSDDTSCDECSEQQLLCMLSFNSTSETHAETTDSNGNIINCDNLPGCIEFSDPVSSLAVVTEDDDPGRTTANCSVVTRANEYCVSCPTGSECETKVVYPVSSRRCSVEVQMSHQ